MLWESEKGLTDSPFASATGNWLRPYRWGLRIVYRRAPVISSRPCSARRAKQRMPMGSDSAVSAPRRFQRVRNPKQEQ